MTALCGQIIGLAINGWAQERFGYRRTMLGALAALGCAIFVPVFSINLPMLCAGFILEGIPWGIFQVSSNVLRRSQPLLIVM